MITRKVARSGAHTTGFLKLLMRAADMTCLLGCPDADLLLSRWASISSRTTVEGTTTAGESGDLLYAASLVGERQIRADLTGNAVLAAGWRDYLGSDGHDVMLSAEAGLTWWLNRYVGLTTRARTDDFAKSMYYQEEDFTVVDRVVELAGKKGASAAQVATAWMLHKPGITAPIIGASKMYQLEEAVAAVEIELSPDEIKYLEEPYRPHRVLGH